MLADWAAVKLRVISPLAGLVITTVNAVLEDE
jgi:hypothetical protein